MIDALLPVSAGQARAMQHNRESGVEPAAKVSIAMVFFGDATAFRPAGPDCNAEPAVAFVSP
jgi:hypothetical protein